MNNKIISSILSISAGLGSYYYYYYYNKKINYKLVLCSSENDNYDNVLRYIYLKYPEEIKEFTYDREKIYHFNEWRYRRKEKPIVQEYIRPTNVNTDIIYENELINININIEKNEETNEFSKILKNRDCAMTEIVIQTITLESCNKQSMIDFINEATKYCKEENENIKKNNKETMNLYYYKKDYWTLLSKVPKRSLSTIYLKKDQKESLINSVDNFFSDETRDIYLSYGIPYKSVNLIYGPPGTGKTSLIKSISSELNCDLYVLPISKDMLDTNLVDAFSYISDNEDNKRIIVIEDIDSLFDDSRKKEDDNNGITLQAFLNCLDGFTCVEGTMLFLTANKPEILDFAMIRSCRVDNKIYLDYADKYQTRTMFCNFLPDQSDNFDKFYKEIKHHKYTTAMLQEFLFYNKDNNNILTIIDKFKNIIEKNDPKNYEIIKDENKNLYN
jgi:SpoVK/Ycf46/Vps4 family AAA+-type ATPase